ncbi:MAG: cytochrome b [Bauldia sp.]|nr:cytochrome b [Bauldia sp.]
MAQPSMPTERPASYSFAQIVLHWTIAALVVWQLFISGRPPRIQPGSVQGFWAMTTESSHVWLGLIVLALVIVRVVLRLSQGAPPPVESSRATETAARVVHFLFYLLLFFMPITGMLAWYAGLPTGDIHELGQPVFIALIVIHVAATGWHQFVKHDGLIRRMIVPAR